MIRFLLKRALDILVNAAGITHSSLLVATQEDLIQDIIDTNLTGTIWACQAATKAMIRQRRSPENTGCIINVSSLLGVKRGSGSSVYAASKAGVIGNAHMKRGDSNFHPDKCRSHAVTSTRTGAIKRKGKHNNTGVYRDSNDQRCATPEPPSRFSLAVALSPAKIHDRDESNGALYCDGCHTSEKIWHSRRGCRCRPFPCNQCLCQ